MTSINLAILLVLLASPVVAEQQTGVSEERDWYIDWYVSEVDD